MLVAALVLGLGLITDPSALHVGAGVALIAFGVFRFVKPRAHSALDEGCGSTGASSACGRS